MIIKINFHNKQEILNNFNLNVNYKSKKDFIITFIRENF